MAKFQNLIPHYNYDIVDADSGYWSAQGIQGCDAMASDQKWKRGDEAWASGETEFEGEPLDVAK